MSRSPKTEPSTAPALAVADEPARLRWKVIGISALLTVLVFIVFGQTIGHDFVNYDDDDYVSANPVVSRGLSLHGVEWAFTHVVSNNWHPVTMLVHMLDCQMYGLWAGGHHLTGVLLHAACAVLLFLLLLEMTGALWRSAFVAAVFAIHPLRVESVAWVSELKDVLSGLFFMLTLLAYARYTRRPESRRRYAMIILWFAIGLMSKPMLVTVPFLLLLLDYWPLGRLQNASQFPPLLREKLPLFALSALSCVATLFAQKQAIGTIENFPLSLRLGHALVACIVYLGKLIWPGQLAVLYPFPMHGPPAWQVICATLLLAALTASTWLLHQKKPYLLVGWLWYLGMLVPAIGIVQVGYQAYADRYTYLPQIGLCIAATWMAADWAAQRQDRCATLGAVALLILGALPVAAYNQTAYWRDSETLWTHALECTQDNFVAHSGLGDIWFEQGRTEEAIAQYNEAIRINPAYADAYNNLGHALLQEGRTAEAVTQYREACQLNPADAAAHSNLGVALCQQGRFEDGIAEYRRAVQIDPAYAEAHYDLGTAMVQQRRPQDAIPEYREALRIDPDYAQAHNNLGNALHQQGRPQEAVAEYREALRINPSYVEAHYNLANALLRDGQVADAIAYLRSALRLRPSDLAIQNELAWTLATTPQPSLRDGAMALLLATQASQANGGGDPALLRTLAAAYAEEGQFSDAVATAQRALQLAQANSSIVLANALLREIKLYQSGRSFEDAH